MIASGRSATRALLALLAGAVAIGFAPIFVRLSETGPSATAFWRVAFAFPALWLWAKWEPSPRVEASSSGWRGILLAGFFFAGDLALWHWSIRLTSVANATLFANFAVIFVVAYSRIFEREQISPRFYLALLIAFGGTVLLVGANLRLGPQTLLGDGLGIITAVFYAGYLLTVKKLRASYSTARIMAGSAAVSAPLLALIALLSGETFAPTSGHGWVLVIALALLSHAAGQSLIAFALAHLRASFSSIGLLLQPVVAGLAAWGLLAERLTPWQLVGGLAVLCGVALARARETPAPSGDAALVQGPKAQAFRAMNALHIIQPYWHGGTWVFDDDRFGLSREPFVAGADTVLTRMVEHIPDARAGFRLIFSANVFPGAQLEVTRTSDGDCLGGAYYRAEQFMLDAWLCPALLHYFPQPPAKIFAKAEPLVC